MAQVSQITINNQAFSTFRTTMNDSFSALNSMHSGTSRPASATTGTLWLDITNAGSNSLTIKFFDGSDDITFATIDTSANTVNFIDSVVTGFDIVTDTTPQLGGNLDLNSNDITGTGDINITGTGTISGDLNVASNVLFVDASASTVGLGTNSPNHKLELLGGSPAISIKSNNTTNGSSNILFGDTNDDDIGKIFYEHGTNSFRFLTNASEKLRIDSSGRLLVGKTVTTRVVAGAEIRNDGMIRGTRDTAHSIDAVRTTDDGDVIRIYKENTNVGVLGTQNWGIGTASPDHSIHISRASSNAQLKLQRTGSSTASYNISASSDALAFSNQVAGSEVMRVNSTGLGIGTSNPQNKLHLDIGTDNTGIRVNSTDATTGIALADNGGSIVTQTTSSGAFRVLVGGDANTPGDNSSEAFRINANGQFLIGTTDAPSNTDTKLRVHVPISSSSKTAFELSHNTTGANKPGASLGLVINNGGASTNAAQLTFGTASGGSVSERMRIDSSGNFFVQKTGKNVAVVGHELNASSYASHTRSDATVLYVNRHTSNGAIAEFMKDNTTVGTIGVNGGDNPFFSSSASNHGGVMFSDAGSGQPTMLPMSGGTTLTDNSVNIGVSTLRYKDLYLAGGVFLGGTGTSNKLDDYEEGLHTASITDSGGTATITMNSSFNQLSYTKIGRLVHVQGTLLVASISATISGTVRISLPFTASSLADQAGKGRIGIGTHNVNFTSSGTAPFLHVGENDAYGQIVVTNDNLNTSQAQFGDTSAQFYIGGTYITDS